MTAILNKSDGVVTPMPWRDHIRATLMLGVPLIGSQLGGMLMNMTDVAMLGWYGIAELAAGSLVTQFWFTVMMFGAGFAYAVVPLAADGEGRGDQIHVRRSVRMGVWVCVFYSLAVMPLLWFTEPIFLLFRQDPEVARLAGDYMRIAQWAILFLLVNWTLRGFLTAIERTAVYFWITVLAVLINAFLNWLFIFGNLGMPELGMRGAAIATLGTNVAALAVVILYCMREKRAQPYLLFVRFWRADVEMIRRVFAVGLPIGLMITAETGMFIFASMFMGTLGVVPLAAHGVVLLLASMAFMVPMGISQAATSRVGLFWGKRQPLDLARAAYTVMGMCLCFATVSAALFFAVPEFLIALFLDDQKADAASVLPYAVPLLFVAACFQLVDSAQAIAAASLRGIQDTRVPMIIATLCYWCVGLGLSYLLGFTFSFGGVGIWTGLALGLASAAIALSWRFESVRPR